MAPSDVAHFAKKNTSRGGREVFFPLNSSLLSSNDDEEEDMMMSFFSLSFANRAVPHPPLPRRPQLDAPEVHVHISQEFTFVRA